MVRCKSNLLCHFEYDGLTDSEKESVKLMMSRWNNVKDQKSVYKSPQTFFNEVVKFRGWGFI